jgi:hypothetical protein
MYRMKTKTMAQLVHLQANGIAFRYKELANKWKVVQSYPVRQPKILICQAPSFEDCVEETFKSICDQLSYNFQPEEFFVHDLFV